MNYVSAPGLVPQDPMFTTHGQLGQEINRGVALPPYSNTAQYPEAVAVFSTTSPPTQSEPPDLVNLSQSKKAKLQHRLSDPFCAKLREAITEVLPRADSVILKGTLQYLGYHLQSKAGVNNSGFGASGQGPAATLLPGSTSSEIQASSSSYENFGHSSPSLINPPRNTSTDIETFQPYDYAPIHSPASDLRQKHMDSLSHPTMSHSPTNRFGMARASMPTPRSIRQPRTQQRAHLSAPPTFSHGPLGHSSSYTSFSGPPLSSQVGEGTFRDSTQSTVSSRSSPSTNSNHTSTTTVDSNTPDMFNALSQATISSTPTPGASAPSRATFSPEIASSSNSTQNFVCSDRNCNKSFTRKEGRERHERAKHSEVKITCLRCICTSACTNPCLNVRHHTPFKDPREDKMKKHLRECHGRDLGRTEKVPRSWLNRYLQVGTSWVCSECRVLLGTWTDNEREINEHDSQCTPWDWWQSVEGLDDFLVVENNDLDLLVGLRNGLERSNLEDGGIDTVSHSGQEDEAVLDTEDEDHEYRDDANPGLW